MEFKPTMIESELSKRFSIGGLKYILNSRYPVEALFWGTFVTSGTIILSFVFYTTIDLWNQFPVRTTLSDTFSVRKIPFPSVTFCQQRPGLEQFGFIERAMNWISRNESRVAQLVTDMDEFLEKRYGTAGSATIREQGVGTKMVAMISIDEEAYKGNAARELIVEFKRRIYLTINSMLSVLIPTSHLTFMEVNSFFVESANNRHLVAADDFDRPSFTSNSLYISCQESLKSSQRKAEAAAIDCEQSSLTDECAKYCAAFKALLSDKRLQGELLEHAILPPTLFLQGPNRSWYAETLALHYETIPEWPFDLRLKSFAKVTQCFMAENELGEKIQDFQACDDVQQTITDIGVCATFHSAAALSLWPDKGHSDTWMNTLGTGSTRGLKVAASNNLMAWQRSLYEPVILAVHESNSFSSFIPGDFTDVQKEAIAAPVGVESAVVVSVKVNTATESVKALAKSDRGCYEATTDAPIEMLSLKGVPYTRENCFFDCRMSLAAKRCACAPWYVMLKYPSAGATACELSGHLCFIRELLNITKIMDDDEHDVTVCGRECLPRCDDYEYFSQLAPKTIYRLRQSQSPWFRNAPPRQRGNPYSCSESFEGALVKLSCAPRSPLYKQRVGDFFRDKDKWERESAVVDVYFDSAKQLATVSDTMSLYEKLSQLGGTLGLFTQFTGWSFIILVNLTFLLVETLATVLWSKTKVTSRKTNNKAEH